VLNGCLQQRIRRKPILGHFVNAEIKGVTEFSQIMPICTTAAT
jgi:hypothetical protein